MNNLDKALMDYLRGNTVSQVCKTYQLKQHIFINYLNELELNNTQASISASPISSASSAQSSSSYNTISGIRPSHSFLASSSNSSSASKPTDIDTTSSSASSVSSSSNTSDSNDGKADSKLAHDNKLLKAQLQHTKSNYLNYQAINSRNLATSWAKLKRQREKIISLDNQLDDFKLKSANNGRYIRLGRLACKYGINTKKELNEVIQAALAFNKKEKHSIKSFLSKL